jgi:hypothetical protein
MDDLELGCPDYVDDVDVRKITAHHSNNDKVVSSNRQNVKMLQANDPKLCSSSLLKNHLTIPGDSQYGNL